MSEPYVLDFSQIGLDDLPRVGGKNASLGELLAELKPKGVNVLDGFATTAAAYRVLLAERSLGSRLATLFENFDPENIDQPGSAVSLSWLFGRPPPPRTSRRPRSPAPPRRF
jgi:pyruvate,water dikinase